MAIDILTLLGTRVDGFRIIQQTEDEIILVLRFIEDNDGTIHEVMLAADSEELVNPQKLIGR